MRSKLFGLAIMSVLAAFGTNVNANGFEGNGLIEKVDIGSNLIKVGEQTYKLPGSTAFEGSPAILQVKPGYQIGYSGELATPYPIISSIYIYPESIRSVEMGLAP